MKKEVSFVTPKTSKTDIVAMDQEISEEQLQTLQNKMDEILASYNLIKKVKNKKEFSILSSEFKERYGIPYSAELIKTLKNKFEPKDQEKSPESVIEMETAKLNVMVAHDQEIENEHAVNTGVINNDEFKGKSELLEKNRIAIVDETIKEAENVISWTGAQNKEQVNRAKKARPGSRSQVETLRERLNDILVFEQKIKEAKGKESQELRKEFKNTFGATYNVSLMNKLKLETIQTHSEPETPDSSINTTEDNTSVVDAGDINNIHTRPDVITPSSPESETVEVEKYDKEVMVMFNKLGISQKDLDSIGGFEHLNVFAQGIIAKGLLSGALEKAENESQRIANAKMRGKGRMARFFQGISNSFQEKNRNKEAITKQINGGLEQYGFEIVKMMDWAQYFNIVEKEDENGNKQVDFLANQNIDESNVEVKNAVDKLNAVALKISSLAKHEIITEFNKISTNIFTEKKNKHDRDVYAMYAEYEQAQADFAKSLVKENRYTNQEAAQILTNVKAKVNMLQFIGANPDLTKDWKEMTDGKGFFSKMFAKDNWKFIGVGFAGRKIAPLLFVSALGAATAIATIPLITASVGAWRAYSRTKNELRRKDRFIDKNSANNHPVLIRQRKDALRALQSFGPKENIDKKDTAKVKAYNEAFSKFTELDSMLKKEANKNIDKKSLDSQSLWEKLDKAIEDTYNNSPEKQTFAMGALQRRIDFVKDLAERGLVNFGKLEDRCFNMINFYEKLRWAELRVINIGFDYESANLNYELSDKTSTSGEKIKIKIQERAEALLRQLEIDSGKKLSEKRIDYFIKKMAFGGVLGAVTGAAGVGLGSIIQGPDNLADAAINTSVGASVVQETVDQSGETVSQSAEEMAQAATNQASENVAEALNQAAEELSSSSVEETANETAKIIFQDVISNEGLKGTTDSVWRSVVQIFKDNAEELGYSGTAEELNQWAAVQTSKALANSGEVMDKVFEGNVVTLEKVAGGFAVAVEQADGLAPAMLSQATVEAVADTASNVVEETVNTTTEEVATEGAKTLTEEVVTGASSETSQKLVSETANQLIVSEVETLHKVIGGIDIYINELTHDYSYFNSDGGLVSGSLIDESGKVITDVDGFFADKLDLFFLDDVAGHLPDANTFLLNNFAWAKPFLDNLGEDAGYVLDLEHGTLTIENSAKAVADAINLGDIDPDSIAEINPIEAGYEIILKNNEGVITLDDFETTLTGERVFTVVAADIK